LLITASKSVLTLATGYTKVRTRCCSLADSFAAELASVNEPYRLETEIEELTADYFGLPFKVDAICRIEDR
jgi:hypothetical protein